MAAITNPQITRYVEANIGAFHRKRLKALEKLRLNNLLRRKNPYLFKSKGVEVAADLVKSLLDAYLRAQEETLFGDFLEGLAIYVAEVVHGGQKSAATGIDLEFSIGAVRAVRYIVSIKSGPNWGNSAQVAKMRDSFAAAIRLVRQGNRTVNVIAVNGCCYGRDASPEKKGYFKYCGQEFWELVSGDANFYKRIIEPLGHDAKRRNQDFIRQYSAVVNRMSQEFAGAFCSASGAIDWDKLVAFGSAKDEKVLRQKPQAADIRGPKI